MNFFQVLKAEAKTIFTDVALVLTVIGGVILYAFLYPQPYLSAVTSELSISIVDLDQSALSKKLRFDLDATSQLHVIQEDSSASKAEKALQRGKIMGFIVIPTNFNRDILLHKRPTIYIGADASYFLVYGGIVESALQTILTLGEKIKIKQHLIREGILSESIKKAHSFSLSSQSMFNPQNSYLQYVVPAVFVLILQQTMLIGMGIAGGGENENRRKNHLPYYHKTRLIERILARVMIFVSIYFAHTLFYFGYMFDFYNISHIANVFNLLNFTFAFLFATASLGMFFGSLLSTREMATPIILFTSLPLIFSAGFVWPLESLPLSVQMLSIFFPSTPAIQGFLHLNQMGAAMTDVTVQYSLLWLQAALYLTLSFVVLKTKKYASS